MTDDLEANGEMTITFQGTQDQDGRLGISAAVDVYPPALLETKGRRAVLAMVLHNVIDELDNGGADE